MTVHFPSGGRLPSASPVLVVGAVMVVLSPATLNSIRVTVSNPSHWHDPVQPAVDHLFC